MKPKLTIITPSYNQAAFIERTINSVLDQGYENLEYLIVDGGSTDGSAKIIERYADHLAWWTSEPDEGQTHALNKGLRRATGDVIAYINSDDYYLPGAFDTAVEALGRSSALWTVGGARYVDSDGGLIKVWWPQPPPKGRHWWLLGPWGVPQAATFWRRAAFERFGNFRQDMHYVFDTEFGIRLALEGEIPVLIDEQLAVRVVHPEAKSWDRGPFDREQRRFFELHAPSLQPRERAALHVSRVLLAARVYGALRPLASLRRRVSRSTRHS